MIANTLNFRDLLNDICSDGSIFLQNSLYSQDPAVIFQAGLTLIQNTKILAMTRIFLRIVLVSARETRIFVGQLCLLTHTLRRRKRERSRGRWLKSFVRSHENNAPARLWNCEKFPAESGETGRASRRQSKKSAFSGLLARDKQRMVCPSKWRREKNR
jgi:hypothetical protein